MTKSQYISPTLNSWGQVWETLSGKFLKNWHKCRNNTSATATSSLVNLPPLTYPARNKALWSGLINHWFPLIRPAIKPLRIWGVALGRRLTSHNISESSSPGWCRKFGREGRLQGLQRLSLGRKSRSSFSSRGCHVLPGNPCGVGHLYWKPVISEVMGPLYSKWYYKWVTGVITHL